jgi:hypothetical protein
VDEVEGDSSLKIDFPYYTSILYMCGAPERTDKKTTTKGIQGPIIELPHNKSFSSIEN